MTPIEAFGALKMTASALKSAIDLNKQVEINIKASELLERIEGLSYTVLELYEKSLALMQEKAELEKKLMSYEQWEKEAARYELHEISDMVFVYAYKKSNENKEPMHYCCAKCMGDRKKTILNLDFDGSDGHKTFHCPCCKNYFSTNVRDD